MKVKRESKVAQSCPTPSNPMDCSPPGSSVHGICQARVLEWVAIAFSSITKLNATKSWQTVIFIYLIHFAKKHLMLALAFDPIAAVHAKSLQSCLTLRDPMDCSLPGSPIHGIFQARVLEWVPSPSPTRPQNAIWVASALLTGLIQEQFCCLWDIRPREGMVVGQGHH